MKYGARGETGLRGCLFGPEGIDFLARRFAASVLRRALVLLACGSLLANTPASRESVFEVQSPSFEMKVSIQFYDGLREAPRFFSASGDGSVRCLGADGQACDGRPKAAFSGSSAVIHFQVTSTAAQLKLREQVRVIDQDVGLPEKKPVDKTILLPKGLGSDLQLFGYYDTAAAGGPENPKPLSANHAPWRILRQDLFFGDEPTSFLVLHWKHALDRITLLDVIAAGSARLKTAQR